MDKMNFLSDCSPSESIDKEKLYRLLVQKRKACTLCDCKLIANPSKIKDGIYDNDAIGPWSNFKGDLNAKVFVVGQDWGNEETYKNQDGKSLQESFTNKRLKELLEVAGFNDSTPMFFTNAILCMKKTTGLGGAVKSSWFRNCYPFLYEQLRIVKPEVLITLGTKAFQALKPLIPEKGLSFKQSVNKQEPLLFYIEGKLIKYFPVYHCGNNGFRNRSKIDQVNDWNRIRISLSNFSEFRSNIL